MNIVLPSKARGLLLMALHSQASQIAPRTYRILNDPNGWIPEHHADQAVKWVRSAAVLTDEQKVYFAQVMGPAADRWAKRRSAAGKARSAEANRRRQARKAS